FVERVADRDHPDLHDDLVDLVHVAAEQLHRLGHVAGDGGLRRTGPDVFFDGSKARAVDDQFADQVDERVEALQIDADGRLLLRFAVGRSARLAFVFAATTTAAGGRR